MVPGVGAFAHCAKAIEATGAGAVVRARVAGQAPVLGICVGMQVLYEAGDEHGERTPGLGVLPGEVTGLHAQVLPHMGWNTVEPSAGSRLFAGLEDAWFFFVHSFAARDVTGPGVTTAWHGEPFTAAVERDALCATQFHPEKSGDAGAALLTNWLETL